jgi:hypothetical protein
MASERPKTLRQQKCPPIQPPQCSDEKITNQTCSQSFACAVECSLKVARQGQVHFAERAPFRKHLTVQTMFLIVDAVPDCAKFPD